MLRIFGWRYWSRRRSPEPETRVLNPKVVDPNPFSREPTPEPDPKDKPLQTMGCQPSRLSALGFVEPPNSAPPFKSKQESDWDRLRYLAAYVHRQFDFATSADDLDIETWDAVEELQDFCDEHDTRE